MTAALVLDHVTKRFGEKVAVDDLSLTIEAGSFVGLLGRNGAGKSTTLKMATSLVDPTSGSIHVLGHDLRTHSLEARRQIGVMPEDMALLELLTGPQYLRFVGRMYGLEDDNIDRRGIELFDTLDLKPGARTLVSDYSFGMKKKLALCAALIHGPKLLFLDEPFEGIDAVTNRTIKTAFRTGWQADFPSQGNFLAPLYKTGGSSNDGDYSNPEFDKLLDEALTAHSDEEATKKYNEAQAVLFKDLPSIPLWYSNSTGGYSENVDNVVFSWKSQPVYYNITRK